MLQFRDFFSPGNLIRRLALSTLAVAVAAPMAQAAGTLNVLTWCDHEDPTLLQPFEAANGVKVNFKDIGSTADALAILGQSKPGDWDVIVMDETDTGRLERMGLLAPLEKADYPFATIPTAIANPKLTSVDGTLYTVPEKFGYNTIAFNKTAADPAAMQDIEAPWDAKYKGRVAVYDYYVPEIQYAALALGKNPDKLTDADLPAIKAKLLALKANAAMVGDVTTVQQALTTGAVDILVGGGEWVTAGIQQDSPNLTYTIPTQGGIRWQQGLGIFAASKDKPMGVKFIQYILSPEGQAKLATSSCYWGMPANTQAALTPAQKTDLRWDEQATYIKHSYPYLQMTPAFDKKLQAMWAEVMRANNIASLRNVKRLAGLWFALPALAWIMFFFLLPVLIMAGYSIRPLNPDGTIGPFSFGDYAAFFAEPAYVTALIDSVTTTLIVVAASTLLAYPFAWCIACVVPKQYQRAALIAAILPFWTSYVVRSYAWLLALSPVGVVNKILLSLGLAGHPLMFAYNPQATEFGFVHFFLMLNTLTIYASLAQINPRYELAARDLGASAWRAFLEVTLPLSIPGVAVGAFLTIVLCIGDYVTPQILGGFRELLLPQVIMMQIQRQLDLPMASTMSLLLTAVVALAYLSLQRWLKMARL